MKRRTLMAAASLATLPGSRVFAAERVIGWVSPESRETTAPFFNAFKTALQSQFPAGGDTIRIRERYVTGGAADYATAVAELQELGVSLIVAQGAATPAVIATKPRVPVVFGYSGDPVVAGFVNSLARPGGNATGMTFMSLELNPKRIDLLRMALPGCRKVALLSNSRHAGEENEIVACQRALDPTGIQLTIHRVQGAAGVASGVSEALDTGAQALVVLPSSLMVQRAPEIVTQCLDRKVPVVSGWASLARAGALLTYGPNLIDAYKRIAHHVARILAGAPPSGLPVEQPSSLELAVNLKTATALGLKLPPTLLALTNEIIE